MNEDEARELSQFIHDAFNKMTFVKVNDRQFVFDDSLLISKIVREVEELIIYRKTLREVEDYLNNLINIGDKNAPYARGFLNLLLAAKSHYMEL